MGRYVFWLAITVLMVSTAQAFAQKCVDQGRPGAWQGNCDNIPSSSSGRTITIWVEQPPVYILGPPQIVWVRPTTAGASQTATSTIDNQAFKRELTRSASTTGYQLYRKGVMALNDGDQSKALAFYEAALTRANSPEEQREIQDAYEKLRQQQAMYDSGEATEPKLVRRFEKSHVMKMEMEIEDIPPALFDPARADLEPLRQEMLPLLYERFNARLKSEEAADITAKAKKSGNAGAAAKAVEQEKKANDDVKVAEQAVEETKKKVFRLVKE